MPRDNIADFYDYRKRRRRIGNIRWVMVLLFALICLMAGYFFAQSAFFGLRKITVSGVSQLSEQQIRDYSGISLGSNIFSVNEQLAGQWLATVPLIKSAKISKSYPATLKIEIVERQIVAIIPLAAGFVFIDNEGVVLKRELIVDELPFPLLTGADNLPSGIAPGTKLGGEKLEALLRVVRQIPEGQEKEIGEIEIITPQQIKLYTGEGIEVILGDGSNFPNKYQAFLQIINDPVVQAKKNTINYVDVSYLEKPVIFYNT